MPSDSPPPQTPTWEDTRALLGCVFQTEAQLTAAVAALRAAFGPGIALHVGASDAARVAPLADQLGLAADVDPEDPLRDMRGLGDESVTRRGVDRGGIIGAAVGALSGLALSFTGLAALLPVAANAQRIALIAVMFVVGAIAGSVWGAAFSPQSSSHAGFRLIDGMQDGGFALLALVESANADAAQKIAESNGGDAITRL
ncbi:MAG: hypothetical protein M3Z37_09750 [Candidatus Eremiobacteraeota bacterium]|nr:hypothetical protein [Candidatus Eremiobacteraeota bacterium]